MLTVRAEGFPCMGLDHVRKTINAAIELACRLNTSVVVAMNGHDIVFSPNDTVAHKMREFHIVMRQEPVEASP